MIDSFFMSILALVYPIAIAILPQLGSSPAKAVLTKGELAMEKHIFLASSSDLEDGLI